MGRVESLSGAAEPLVIRVEGDTVTIPDAHLLFSGDFSRSGADLVIAGEGQSVVVADYFGDAGAPALAAPNGAVLMPDVVSALAGPLAPGQYAQAADAQPAQGIGSVVSLTGSATAQRSDGTVVDLTVDSRLAEGDVVQTASGSALGIVFDDGAVFNLNAESRMVLNELVYEPGGGSNSMLFSMVQGVFAFVAGQVAPTGEMRIDTPVATMGIRGTSGIVKLETIDGVGVFRVVPDPVTNEVGTIVLYSPGTDIILVVMDSSDSQWAIDPATGEVIEQPVDPGDAEIIEQLHQTYIEFAGIVDDPGDTRFAQTNGSGLPTQFALTPGEIAAIVALSGGALPQIEPLSGEPASSGVDFGYEPDDGGFEPAPPPPPSDQGSSDPQQLPGGFTGHDFGSVDEDGAATTTGRLDFAGGTGLIEPLVVKGTFGTFEIDADGNWVYTLDNESAAVQSLGEGDSAEESFAVVSADGSETQFVTIAVQGVNDVPTVTGTTTGAVVEDGTQEAKGTITVADPDAGESSVQPQSNVVGTYGTFSILADGSWTYVLDNADPGVQGLAQGETVTDSFTVTSFDGTATETVTVTVNGSNNQPVAQDDGFATDEDTAVNGNVLAANGNGPDGDVDGDPLAVTQVNGSTENVGFQIVLASGALLLMNADGSFAYDPNGQFEELGPGDSVQDSFTYTVADGEGGSDTATVTLTINGVDDQPVATDSLIATNQDTGVVGELAGSDVDADSLTFSLEQGPQNGTVVVNPADGVYDYTPDEGFTGEDSFTYRVTDGQGAFDIATVDIVVAPVGEFAAPKTITGTPGNDVLVGSVFNDVLNGGEGSDELFGGDGDDLLDGGPAVAGDFDYVDGGAGNDTLIAASGFVNGGPGDDVLDGLPYYEAASVGVIINLSDADQVVNERVVQARTAIDEFGDTDRFGASVQAAHASDFDDVVFGSDLNAYFFLRAGDDVIDAGGGNDAILAGSGNDTIDGGSGFDEVNYTDDGFDGAGPIEMGVVVDLQSGTATDGWGDTDTLMNVEQIVGTHLADTIAGDQTENWLEGAGGNDTISGGAGHDGVIGGTGDDTLFGGDGDDIVDGGLGDDSLSGGFGNDTLVGGPGADSMNGGAGADRFGFRTPDDGVDSIIDFGVSEDVLVIDASVFGGGLFAGQGLSANQFVSGDGPQPTAAHGQFLYDSVLGELSFDVDGTGGQEAVHFATLAGAPALTESHFELIGAGGSFVGSSQVAAAVDGGGEPVA